MAQVGAAVTAQCLGADHATRVVFARSDGALGNGLVETGPAATGVKLGAGGKQWLVAADTVVNTVLVMVGVLAGKGPLGRGVARDLYGMGLSTLCLQQCLCNRQVRECNLQEYR